MISPTLPTFNYWGFISNDFFINYSEYVAAVDEVLYTCRALGEALTGGSNGLSFLKVVS